MSLLPVINQQIKLKNMNTKITLFLLTLLVITFSSCKDDPERKGDFILEVKATANDKPMVIKNEVYRNVLQYNYKVDRLAFYLSNLYLIKNDGTEVLAKDVSFLEFENNHSVSSQSGELIIAENIPEGNYKGIKFAIGVDSTINNEDPAIYASEHPLSITNNAHWTWNSGYIFVKFEGKIDSLPNGNEDLSQILLYHLGTNPLYREVSFDHNFTVVAGNEFVYQLQLDIDRIFFSESDTLDARHDNDTQTLDNFDLAERVTNLFVNAISELD